MHSGGVPIQGEALAHSREVGIGLDLPAGDVHLGPQPGSHAHEDVLVAEGRAVESDHVSLITGQPPARYGTAA